MVSPQRRNPDAVRPAFSGCMGLCVRFFIFSTRPRGGKGQAIRRAEPLDQPIRRGGTGGAQIADDRPDPAGPQPMLPRIAIAARRTAALAPVHATPPAAVHRRRPAGEAGTGAGAATGSAGEDCGLCGGAFFHSAATHEGLRADQLSGKYEHLQEQKVNINQIAKLEIWRWMSRSLIFNRRKLLGRLPTGCSQAAQLQ